MTLDISSINRARLGEKGKRMYDIYDNGRFASHRGYSIEEWFKARDYLAEKQKDK